VSSSRFVSLLAVLVVACAAPAVSAPSSISSLAVATSSSNPTATASAIGRGSFAAVCGTISDFVSDTAQTNGSFVLDSPGRDPLRITIPAGRLGGVAANYVCIAVLAAVPHPLFDGFLPGGTPGFIASGSFPATSASPAPTGFTPPQTCAYVAPPVVAPDQTEWKIDCGAANKNARGILGGALTQQGWRSCGSALATAQWQKNDVMLTVTESSLVPGDYPRLTQYARVVSPCS